MHRNGFLASVSAPLLTLSLPPWWGTSLKTHNVINTIGIKCHEILNATNWPFLKRVLPEEKNISMIAISFSSSPTYDVGLVTKFEIGINWLGHREVVLSSATRHWKLIVMIVKVIDCGDWLSCDDFQNQNNRSADQVRPKLLLCAEVVQ